MKNKIVLISVIINIWVGTLNAQNVSISSNGGTPDASAMLDIQSGSMGLSIPNVALTGLTSSSPIVSAPKTGLIIYNTATAGTSPNNVVPGYYYWNGAKWVAFSGNGSNNWSLAGNAGTTAGTNFIGTTDAVDFVAKANNTELIRASAGGYVGINNPTPGAQLDVAAGTTTVNTAVNATGSINDYLQFNIQNTNSGTHAQSGYSSTADNGTNTTGFAWMGINNSTFNYPTAYNIGGANDVSFLGSGQDMYLANANNTKSIIFSTGKSTTPFFTERMRITNAGYIGVGTSSPAYPIDVQTTLSTAISGYGYLNATGSTGYIGGSSGTMPFSARFIGRVICPEFDAQSDARIKDIKQISNSEKDLETLNKIKITDYEMKDKVLWGNKKFKKVIAQEIEKVYPQVVNKSIGFIPSIYQLANIQKCDQGYNITFKDAINISVDTKLIRVIRDNVNIDLHVLSITDNKTILVKEESAGSLKDNEQVFVYGEEIYDFRVVDYEGLSTLNISATQQLYKLIKKQQEEMNLLKNENEELKKDMY